MGVRDYRPLLHSPLTSKLVCLKIARLANLVGSDVGRSLNQFGELFHELLEMRRQEVRIERRLIGPLFKKQEFAGSGLLLIEVVRDATCFCPGGRSHGGS